MDYEKQSSRRAGERSNTRATEVHRAPGRTTAVELLQRSALAAPMPSGFVQRASDDAGSGAGAIAPGAEAAVAQAGGAGGAPVPGDVRALFESSLGTDLSAVRLHTGAASADASAAIGARAYTVGQDIHFGAGQYDATSPGGRQLLAHEVAHTVQQAGGAASGPQTKLAISSPGDALELEADRAAAAMVTGAPASVGSGGSVIARSSAPPKPAYDMNPHDGDKAPKDMIGGMTNLTATIDWDKSAKLYGIDGPEASSLRSVYEGHLREQLASEPLMRELGVQALLPSEVGARIERIANESEPVFVGATKKSGGAAAQPYRQALWRCSQRAIIATLSTSTSRRYKSEPGKTFCNVYSADMVNAMGGYLPRVWYIADHLDLTVKPSQDDLDAHGKADLNANQIGSWLNKWGADYGWRQIDNARKAQDAANSGKVVIAQASKVDTAKSGHVNVIIAEGNGHYAEEDPQRRKGANLQPLQSQAGATNYEYSDTAAQPNGAGWWKAAEDGGAQLGDAMKKEPGGNFWIYEGAHQANAVASATEMGGTFK